MPPHDCQDPDPRGYDARDGYGDAPDGARPPRMLRTASFRPRGDEYDAEGYGPDEDYGSDGPFGPDDAYGRDVGYEPDAGYEPDIDYGPDFSYEPGSGYASDDDYPVDDAYGRIVAERRAEAARSAPRLASARSMDAARVGSASASAPTPGPLDDDPATNFDEYETYARPNRRTGKTPRSATQRQAAAPDRANTPRRDGMPRRDDMPRRGGTGRCAPQAGNRSPRRRRPLLAIAAVLVVIALVAAGLMLWHPWAPATALDGGASDQASDQKAQTGETDGGDDGARPDKAGENDGACPGEAPGQVAEEGDIAIPFDPAAFPLSTPRERWGDGKMPYLYQKDVAWRDEPYAGGTVGDNACGPTCMDMVYIYLTGDASYTPADLAAQADAGNFAPTGATEWIYMTQGAAQLGLSSTTINPYYNEVVPALEAGMPVIASLKPGDFTLVGHYIVLTGIDENGMVSIHDPNSVLNSTRKWGIAQILRQANMCWALSR